jgi:hypothetical protein
MGWPTSHDYSEALQHPLRRFSKPELKRAQAALGDDGKPLVHRGQRVDVFELRSAGAMERWAIGCFLEEPQDLARRYQLINEHLQQHPAPSLVETEYLDQGICIRGHWHPIIRSRWVDSVPLNEFVRENANDPTELRSLAVAWIKLAHELRRARIAHGNLCCDTVLVVPGKGLQLVDYDALFVPALAGTPPPEMGHGAFQHPDRALHQTYDASVDRFAHLVVFTALHAVAAGGQTLWERFDKGSNLLFGESDWSEPGSSALLRSLWQSQDQTVRVLVGHLILASQGNLADVPRIEHVADAATLNSAAVEHIDALLGDGLDLRLTIDDNIVDDLKLVVEDEPEPESAPSSEAITKPLHLPLPPPVPDMLDMNVRTYSFDAWLPERIAIMKLQGFVRDAGGEIVMSVPGQIRVQMLNEQYLARGPKLLTWLGLVQPPATTGPRVLSIIDLYLMHKPTQGRQMIGITVQLTPGPEQDPGDRWQPYCDRVFCELRAYLVGYQ